MLLPAFKLVQRHGSVLLCPSFVFESYGPLFSTRSAYYSWVKATSSCKKKSFLMKNGAKTDLLSLKPHISVSIDCFCFLY